MDPWELSFLRSLHPVLWLAWMLYWTVSARGVKRTARRETAGQRLVYTLPLVIAVVMFWNPGLFPRLSHAIYPGTWTAYGLGTVLLVTGLAFSIWARVILGRNWSGTVTVKEDHELIQSGPYRFVRHPIYTGLLVALTGSAVAQDLWSSALAVLLIAVSFWVKLLREEGWMRETFGEQYDRYCARTARLIPYVL